MVRSRRIENLYHNRSELENIKTDFTLVVTSCIFDDGYAYPRWPRAGIFDRTHANISISKEDNEDL